MKQRTEIYLAPAGPDYPEEFVPDADLGDAIEVDVEPVGAFGARVTRADTGEVVAVPAWLESGLAAWWQREWEQSAAEQ